MSILTLWYFTHYLRITLVLKKMYITFVMLFTQSILLETFLLTVFLHFSNICWLLRMSILNNLDVFLIISSSPSKKSRCSYFSSYNTF